MLLTMYRWTYDTSDAVDYAEDYYSSINSIFDSSVADWSKFCVAMVWAGFGGAADSTSYPAVSTSAVGSSSNRVWCRDQCHNILFHYKQKLGMGQCKRV
jgi:hypothetical protein